eukprot:4690-Rhodomonas_salina.2
MPSLCHVRYRPVHLLCRVRYPPTPFPVPTSGMRLPGVSASPRAPGLAAVAAAVIEDEGEGARSGVVSDAAILGAGLPPFMAALLLFMLVLAVYGRSAAKHAGPAAVCSRIAAAHAEKLPFKPADQPCLEVALTVLSAAEIMKLRGEKDALIREVYHASYCPMPVLRAVRYWPSAQT